MGGKWTVKKGKETRATPGKYLWYNIVIKDKIHEKVGFLEGLSLKI